MLRRNVLQTAGALALAHAAGAKAATPLRRVRPGDPAWPSLQDWAALNRQVGGQLLPVRSPLGPCRTAPDSAACVSLFKDLKNAYAINASDALTQTTGWLDAWTSAPSAYAVAARNAADVAAAVDFARVHNLRLVVKGGGHSYQGTSNAPDSLLIWTRPMDAITLHDGFVPAGSSATPQPAVSLGAGAIWLRVYNAVMTQAGRYVQGGGCATVGVAGLIQSGGFGSFSKAFGMAAAGLLEAEVVTADGRVRIANGVTNPGLFWGLKGGGGGSLGVVTRLTLRTHPLPAFLGGAFLTVKAADDASYRRLVARFLSFCRDSLCNPHWGESVSFGPGNLLAVTMVFQGLSQTQAEAAWQPFVDWVAANPAFSVTTPVRMVALAGRDFWNPAYLRRYLPQTVIADDRPGAPAGNVFWAGNLRETGWFLYDYDSAWLPAGLLSEERQAGLVEALFGASRHWRMALHVNKGLAGAPAEAVAAAGDTAMNPAVQDAFALAICAAGADPAYPGISGHAPDVVTGRRQAEAVRQAMACLRALVPDAGSYVSEGDYFNPDWQRAYWGTNYSRLLKIKQAYDPAGLFFVHHGVGSEGWSADGFQRLA